jgi:hypothetical protein
LLKKKRRVGIHDINGSRAMFGKFHHLFTELRQEPASSWGSFTYVYRKIRQNFIKSKTPTTEEITNFKKPIFSEERLCVTPRKVKIKKVQFNSVIQGCP